MQRSYVLISPCRNEADYMQQTLDSVIAQSITPDKWIIVDDGSTDETPEILKKYATEYGWIEIVTRENRGHRSVGPGVIDAFYAGFESIVPENYTYLCKLDLDLVLPEKYFESLMLKMESEKRLGTCSGKAYKYEGNKLVVEHHGDENSMGASKFYRMECFSEIGGFVREVMWDGIDCHRCRMLGWIARSSDEPELNFIHLRPMGSSQKGIITGRIRHGYGQYFMGTGLLFITASSLLKMAQSPLLVGGIMIFWGWLKSALTRAKRYEDLEFRRYLRRYQMRALFVGKKRATLEIDNLNRERFSLK